MISITDTSTFECMMSSFMIHLSCVSDENVELLLRMAEEYKVESLTTRCRKFLVSRLKEVPVHPVHLISSLRMAVDSDFEEVRQACFDVANKIPSDTLESTRGYDLLTSDVKLDLKANRLKCFEETGRKIHRRLREAETHCGLYHKNERWGDNLCNKCLASIGKTAGFEISRLF